MDRPVFGDLFQRHSREKTGYTPPTPRTRDKFREKERERKNPRRKSKKMSVVKKVFKHASKHSPSKIENKYLRDAVYVSAGLAPTLIAIYMLHKAYKADE